MSSRRFTMTRAGNKREQIQIQSQSASVDSQWGNDGDGAWSEFATLWSDVDPTGGAEAWREGVQSKNPCTFKIRYLDGVNSQMRVVWRSRTFDIVSAVDIEALGREIVIVAVEHPAS